MRASGGLRALALLAMATSLVAGGGRGELALPEGRPIQGRKVFIQNYCGMCHHVSGRKLPRPLKQPWADIQLGGWVEAAPSDAYLVTEIIHPNHRIDTRKWPDPQGLRISPMLDYTVNLTARDLIDLVAFLKSAYAVKPKE